VEGDPAIAITSLRVRRGGTLVLDGLSLTVPAGQVTGLLGPSGGGKSTVMRAIVGVQKIESGTVEVLGRPAGTAALRSVVAYTPQGAATYTDLSVRENLRYFARLAGVEASRIDAVLATVDLAELADRRVGHLSGGQRARVSLAAALLGEPHVLVLDEPTVGLDPLLRRDLWKTFHELAAAGATLVVSSHVMDEAERCDSLLLLRDGELIATGTPQELRDKTGADRLDDVFLRLVEDRA
jgi:ABC-2 type transport system ATP-binding protein